MSKRWKTIAVTPASEALGAEIDGVDIATGISDEQFREIRQAFSDYGVIFFREQHITPAQHIAFAERWGTISINRFFSAVDEYPQIAEVRKEPDQTQNIGSNWHTDQSYDQIPAMGSILYALDVPKSGGDTLFASMYAAHDELETELRTRLSRLQAVHSSRHVFGKEGYTHAESGDLAGRIGNTADATQVAIHPVIIKHPLSGRPALYVNGNFTVNFEGWTVEESQPLLDYLFAHACREEFICRFEWHEGSMAIWDNRATHHRALNDYPGEGRLMHRITIAGQSLQPAAS